MGTTFRLLAVAAASALTVGCGGSDEAAEPQRYTVEPTRACLVQAGQDVETEDVDFVATTASGGALVVRLPATDNFVSLAFGADRTEGVRLARAYREFAGRSIPIDDVLQRAKNVVLVWNGPPTAEESGIVIGCLSGPE